MLLKDSKQTNKQTNKTLPKFNLICQGGNKQEKENANKYKLIKDRQFWKYWE